MENKKILGSMGEINGELKLPEREGKVPLIILSHGFGGNHENNNDYAAYLTHEGFATYNFDFCGGGPLSKSQGDMLSMTVLTEAKDLESILNVFSQDERFSSIFLLGESQGGFVSSYVAAKNAQLVKGLVLYYPAYIIPDDARKRALPDGSFPETSQVFGLSIGRAYGEAATSFDIYEVLPGYEGNVLILHGDKDTVAPLSYSERASKAFPHAELVVLPGQVHGFTGEGRVEAIQRTLAFFKKWE